MRAVVHDRYGPPEVLRVAEVGRPVPKDDEVLVRIHASTVTRTDTGLRSAEYPFSRLITGIRRPKRTIAGMEFAGRVEDVGAAVTDFRVGDEVFGIEGGANAEYVTARESGVIALSSHGCSGAGVRSSASVAIAGRTSSSSRSSSTRASTGL
jgi:NADPH:quinone reductase-like Zn-dependent oxidoreductase